MSDTDSEEILLQKRTAHEARLRNRCT